MSRLYLVRHGRTAHNLARRIQGPLLDEPLDDVGRTQADALGARFAVMAAAGERFGGLYASPMRRALDTAEPVSRALRLPVALLPGVVEFSWGEFMGKVEEGDVAAFTKDLVRRWTAGEIDHRPPGGESPREAARRAAEAIGQVMAAHPEETFVVVAHGRINKVILAHLLHRDLARMEDFPQFNTAVTLIEREVGELDEAPWRAVYVNDRRHLDGIPHRGVAASTLPAGSDEERSRFP